MNCNKQCNISKDNLYSNEEKMKLNQIIFY